jgi:hypothetical protein
MDILLRVMARQFLLSLLSLSLSDPLPHGYGGTRNTLQSFGTPMVKRLDQFKVSITHQGSFHIFRRAYLDSGRNDNFSTHRTGYAPYISTAKNT